MRSPQVAVVGAADCLGQAVVDALRAALGTSAVVALDEQRGAAEGPWRIGAIDEPSIATRLRGVQTVVFLAAATTLEPVSGDDATARRLRAVRRTQAVVTAAAAVGAHRLVAVTSAMVLGAAPDNPVPLSDGAPLAAPPDTGLVGDLLEVEHVLARSQQTFPGLALSVLRPAALVGPGVDTVVTRHFEAPRLLFVREARTQWQFCHLSDLAQAVAVTVTEKLTGHLTVGCLGSLSQDAVEQLSGMRRVELPAAVAFRTAYRLHRVGVLPAPASDLAFVVYPWVVAAEKLRAAGWQPEFDNVQCLELLLEHVRGHHAVAARRLDRKDAALGAAGAAVALMGTAAMVRRRRRRDG